MEGAKASSSSVRLIFVVFLVGAFAGANCSLTVVNFSQQPVQVFDLTMPSESVITPSTFVKFPVNPLPVGESTPEPETLAVFTFITAPNATQNVTGVREAFPFLIAYVYENSTITLTESNTTKKLSFSIDYSA